MHLAVLNGKIIDVTYRAAREPIIAERPKGIDEEYYVEKIIDPGCTEIAEESHIEVIKVFLEYNDNEVEKNYGIDGLNYYEISVDPESAHLEKVV